MVDRRLLDVYKMFIIFHLPRKLLFLSLAFFALNATGVNPSLNFKILLGFLIFFIGYTSIYFINDFFDYEFDLKRKHLSYNKPLVTLKINPKTFCYLGYLHAVLGLTLAVVYSPHLALLLGITLAVAHIRSAFKGSFSRVLLIILLEYLNFLTLSTLFTTNWYSIARASGIFLAVALLYGFGYRAYRKPESKRKYVFLSILSFLIAMILFNAVFKYSESFFLTLLVLGPIFGIVNINILAREGRNYRTREKLHGLVALLAAFLIYMLTVYLKG